MGEKKICHHSFLHLLYFQGLKNEIFLKKPLKLRFLCHFLLVDLILPLALAEIRKNVTQTVLQTVCKVGCNRRICNEYSMPGCFLTNLCRSTNWSKWDKNRHQKGPKHKRHSWVIKLVFLPKQVSQKHIFDISYTLGVIHRPKMCKIGPKRRSKVRNSIV